MQTPDSLPRWRRLFGLAGAEARASDAVLQVSGLEFGAVRGSDVSVGDLVGKGESGDESISEWTITQDDLLGYVPVVDSLPTRHAKGKHQMSSLDEAIKQLLSIEGATGAAIVDYASGMALAQGGNPSFDLGIAAAGNSNVVRAKLSTMSELGVTDEIDDILITLSSQYHLINVLNTPGSNGLFIYLVLSRTSANLALARHKLKTVASQIAV
ncbi:hypothetical protein [Pseudoclavibacter sp. RFBA6]|uniref:hypothetical protein n=1 Tax=Pseudoclavibacter sp. RFBA6 TaxID=2080573 RepID=UPI0021576825|nr:hypothetical protein [Pseudoclavibacter sp. RFBA6]